MGPLGGKNELTMGRELLQDRGSQEGFRVPIIKEASVNERPSISEITGTPSAIEGLSALGEMIHRTARRSYERAMEKINHERQQTFTEISRTEPDQLPLRLLEEADACADEVMAHDVQLREHDRILEERTTIRPGITDEFERVEADL